MHKIRKKIGAITLALVLSSSVFLTGCSGIRSIVGEIRKEKEAGMTESGEPNTSEVDLVPEDTEGTEAVTPVDPGKRHFSLEEAAGRHDRDEEPLTTMEIASLAQPAVVAIYAKGTQDTVFGTVPSESAGSGVIISEDGYIVTNNHVIDGAKDIEVVLATGQTYEGKLIGASKINDLAVVKIEAESALPFSKIGNSDDLLVGELVVAVGNPLGDFQGTVTAGIVSSLGRTLVLESGNGELIELSNLIQTDAAINGGNSGGGLFNSFGELIGINVAKASGSGSGPSVEGLGFAIPINTAKPIVTALINDGYVSGLPTLQIRGQDISPQMAASYGKGLVVGVWISDIAEDSAAYKAGLRPGDIITEFAGEKIVSVSQLNIVKNRHKAGDEVKMKFYRGGDYKEISFKLDEYKENH